MQNPNELLAPLEKILNENSAAKRAGFVTQIEAFTRESDQLQGQLDELYRFNPVKHILSGGDRGHLAQVTSQVSELEHLVEVLAECVNQLTLEMNAANRPQTESLGQIAVIIGAVQAGKVAILQDRARNAPVNRQEKITMDANLKALSNQLKMVSVSDAAAAAIQNILSTLEIPEEK